MDDLGAVPGLLRQLLLIAVAFCAMSSATYLLNDLMDREDDRKHPAKRSRPIAASLVGVPAAVTAMLVLALCGVAVMALVKPALAAASFIYLGVNVAYSLGLKRVVVLDLMAVANGYVIRIAAGALAIDVFPSPWLFVTTGAGALFIVLGRRYAEVRLAGDAGAGTTVGLAQVPRAFRGSTSHHVCGCRLVKLYFIHSGGSFTCRTTMPCCLPCPS